MNRVTGRWTGGVRRACAWGCALVWGAAALTSTALGPHELLVLVNSESARSVRIGREFARMRQVPDCNVVEVALPKRTWATGIRISPREYRRRIWTPAWDAAVELGIDDHVPAWIFSTDFPVCVTTAPEVSITGFTFLGGQFPDLARLPVPAELRRTVTNAHVLARISMGYFRSPLFAGPNGPKGGVYASRSLEQFQTSLGAKMPVCSMMLGYVGTNGNTEAEVLACLRRGLESDGTEPDGTVYLVGGEGTRAKCRRWQYERVVGELRARDVSVVIQGAPPHGARKILGLMMGSARVDPSQMGRFVPGAVADHLTSFGARFTQVSQTKISAWIRHGATATAGTVTEPGAIWMKFPHARFFAHYRDGCTILEAYYQSLSAPLQILPLGDPLAGPWTQRVDVGLTGFGRRPVSGLVRIGAILRGPAVAGAQFLFLIDGHTLRERGVGRVIDLDTRLVPDGPHRVRVVAYTGEQMGRQGFCEETILVKNTVGKAGRKRWLRR